MPTPFERPYVVSWNLTYRCNLACEHCYLDAGGSPLVTSESFADRSELTTEQCCAVIDQLAAFAPECLTILTGGEPLLRRDIIEIVRYAAAKGLWVVIGTNGVKITETLARRLAAEGVRGLSLSLDALDPEVHDTFRNVRGAWRNTVEGAEILRRVELPFIVQTTAGAHNLGRIEEIAAFAWERLEAKVWNLYFLVPTGRGQFVSDITPAQYDDLLAALFRIERTYRGRMLVNAKCAPHFVKTVLEEASAERAAAAGANPPVAPVPSDTRSAEHPRDAFPPAPLGEHDGPLASLRAYTGGAGGCPAGTHYLGIRPNGDVTPCPYLPLFAGNLRAADLAEIWSSSDLFVRIRERSALGGRCGACELSGRCGGCRARAFGMTGDVMAEDPLCTHEPGRFADSPFLAISGSGGSPSVVYGLPTELTISWDDGARERIGRVPAFVRGMVIRAVEESCRKSGTPRVTVEVLDRIRERMPTTKLFRRPEKPS